MQPMTNEEWEKYKEILLILAKRKYPETSVWRSYFQSKNLIKCLIYDQIDYIHDNVDAREHGLQHLKEYNLLPFL